MNNRSKKGLQWIVSFIVMIILATVVITSIISDITKNNDTQSSFDEQKMHIQFIRSVDGDTAQLKINEKEEKVRFLLIDTPETVKDNTPIQPFGKEASQKTKALLSKAKTIRIEYEAGQERDEYGRVLAYIFVDGELLQNILVKEGLARVAFFKGHEKYLALLKESQTMAKKQKLNIWSIDGYVTNRGFDTSKIKK